MSRGIKATRVVVVTANNCAYCDRAKAFLLSRKVPFRERNLETSRSANAEFQRLGARGVPLILVGNRRIEGYRPDLLGKALRKAGFAD